MLYLYGGISALGLDFSFGKLLWRDPGINDEDGAMAVAVAAAGIRHSSYGLVHTARCEFARWVEKQHGEATFCCFGVDFLLELLLLFFAAVPMDL